MKIVMLALNTRILLSLIYIFLGQEKLEFVHVSRWIAMSFRGQVFSLVLEYFDEESL